VCDRRHEYGGGAAVARYGPDGREVARPLHHAAPGWVWAEWEEVHTEVGGAEAETKATEDRERMQEYVNPTRSLTVAEAKKDVEIDMFDDQEHKSAFFTDGRRLQKTKDSTTQEIAAHWDGNRLVTDEKSPSGRKISRTYELSTTGCNSNETLRLTRGHSDSQISIRYVYDQADARTAHSSQTRQ